MYCIRQNWVFKSIFVFVILKFAYFMQTVISPSIKVLFAKKCINLISRTELKPNIVGWKILERLELRTKKCKTLYSNVVLILHEMHKLDNNNMHQVRNNVDEEEKNRRLMEQSELHIYNLDCYLCNKMSMQS